MITDEIHFRRENGTIYLYDGDRMRVGYKTLGFILETEAGFMVKYGEEALLQVWMTDARQKYSKAGLDDLCLFELITAPSDKWDLDDCNKFISVTGYLGRWQKRQRWR